MCPVHLLSLAAVLLQSHYISGINIAFVMKAITTFGPPYTIQAYEVSQDHGVSSKSFVLLSIIKSRMQTLVCPSKTCKRKQQRVCREFD